MLRALDLAEAVDAGDLTPSTVIELCAEAIVARETQIKAFAHLMLDEARLAARRLKEPGPLMGLPLGIKDIIDTADAPTEMGSPVYKGWRPKADASLVQMIRQASGIVLGKTATTEFAQLNPAPTVNPHDPAATPGGSSSGSAAAVAAGMLPLAIGTQTGGSIIRPAAFCGVTGVKPSFGLLPRIGIKAFAWSFDTAGIFAARAVDAAYGLAAITGRPLRVDGLEHGTPRIGIFLQEFAGEADMDAIEALERARRAFEKTGAKVSTFKSPPEFAAAHGAHGLINNFEAAQALAWERLNQREKLSKVLIKALDEGAATPHEAYDEARGLSKRARRAARDVFQAFDLLLTYSARGAAPDRSWTGDPAFNKLITLLGTPAVTVPVMKNAKSLPLGVQIVAAFGRDHQALAGAAMLEEALTKA